MERTFTMIYENKIWGDNKNTNYNGSSGDGSRINYNENTYIPFIKKFINDNNIKTIVDLGCGDFVCGPLIYNDLDILYTGYDVYNKVIENNSTNNPSSKYEFTHLDFYNNKEQIKSAELCILKDVLQHWSLDKINIFLDYLIESKKFKYILITNCCNQVTDNTDILVGQFRDLSCDFFPLKKYNPIKLFNYYTKEVSLIQINNYI
jgi:hypothetical protein